jgi:hypothetical protein
MPEKAKIENGKSKIENEYKTAVKRERQDTEELRGGPPLWKRGVGGELENRKSKIKQPIQ